MSALKKLMQARIKLQNTKLNKSGHNKFAGYKYFELGDFLPSIQTIFNDVGLCGVVSFGTEIASLTITDLDDGSEVMLTSPMSTAALKGCHEVQNLGAVQTYLRRYLWVSAMEIVEHDAIDAVTGLEPAKSVSKEVFDSVDSETKVWLEEIAANARKHYQKSPLEAVEYIRSQNLDPDERVALNALFDSKERAAMKKSLGETK